MRSAATTRSRCSPNAPGRYGPDFTLDAATASPTAAVCRRVDGNPLAIELAAARVRVLTVGQIAAALDDGVDLLVERNAYRPARQRTVRAALDWSHRLLDPQEADLFSMLSVFAGGAELAAVERVSTPGDGSVLDALAGLVDKSLLRVDHTRTTARYGLPDPVRRYAAEQLARAESERDGRDRHLAWALELAEAAERSARGSEQLAKFDQLDREFANLRAAFEYAMNRPDVAAALRLAAAVAPYCSARGRRQEGVDWLERAIAAGADHLDDAVGARALDAAGVLAFLRCDYAIATNRLEAAGVTYDALGDAPGLASVTRTLGSIAREQGDYDRADELLRDSASKWDAIGDDTAAARCRNVNAVNALLRGDTDAARATAMTTLTAARRLQDNETAVSSLLVLGWAATASGDLAVATEYLTEALADATGGNYVEGIAYAHEGLGLVALRRHDVDDARRLLRDALRAQHQMGDRWRSAALLVGLAGCDIEQREFARAVRSLAAAEALLERIDGALALVERPYRDRTRAAAAAAMAPDDFAVAWAGGRSAALDRIVADVLRGTSEIPKQRSESTPEAGLRLLTLGHEQVLVDGRLIGSGEFTYARPRELLYLLADASPIGKSDIGLALWPEASAAELRGAFHTTLHHLRRAIGPDRIRYQQGRYALVDPQLRYDVRDFTDGLAAARAAGDEADEIALLRAATDHYAGDYLPDTAPAWAGDRRARLKDQFERALLALGRRLMRARRPAAAVEAYRRALASDPLLESAHRGLMRGYAAQGEPSRAIREYEEFAEMLRAALGTAPASETDALLVAIRGS